MLLDVGAALPLRPDEPPTQDDHAAFPSAQEGRITPDRWTLQMRATATGRVEATALLERLKMTRRRKAKLAAKTGKVMIEHPRVRHATTAVAVPVAKRRLRKRGRQAARQLDRYGAVARTAGGAIAERGPGAAQALGLYEPPAPKRTAPRVAAGIVIGAALAYFLDPVSGRARRAKLNGSSPEPDTTG
jgi:hypothetical protein